MSVATRLSGWSWRSPATSTTTRSSHWCASTSGRGWSRPQAGAAAQGHRPGAGSADAAGGQSRHRADPPVPGRAHTGTALGASVGAVGAQHRAGWRPEFPSVPTDPGNARAGVLGVFDGRHVLRHRRALGVRRLPARAVRRGGPGDHRRAADGRPRRDHRRRSAGSPRARCVAGWCSVWRTPARGCTASAAASSTTASTAASRQPRADRRGHRRGGERGGAAAADPAVRRRGPGSANDPKGHCPSRFGCSQADRT